MQNYTLDEKYNLIQQELCKTKSTNPIEILKTIMHKEFINIHGPEHHFLDGASLMTAMKNAGLQFDFEKSLQMLLERTQKMPGAMCGFWGVCGAVSSVGAVLSIIDSTGPLSTEKHYASHMAYTSKVLDKMSQIGGPRCCKRHAFLALEEAIEYCNQHYNIKLETTKTICEFSPNNMQCLKEKCPFYSK